MATEYCFVMKTELQFNLKVATKQDFLDYLNKMGAHGWTLVMLWDDAWFFSREIEINPELRNAQLKGDQNDNGPSKNAAEVPGRGI